MNQAVKRAHELKAALEADHKLSDHETDLLYLCIRLGFSDSQTGLVIQTAGIVEKEQYLIACFLDGVDESFAAEEIVKENDISRIKEKRYDYLLENFRKDDPVFHELEMNLDDCKRQIIEFTENAEQMKAILEEYENEEHELIKTRSRLAAEIELLKSEKQKLQQKLMRTNELAEADTQLPDEHQSSKPKSFAERIKCLFTDSDDTENFEDRDRSRRPHLEESEKNMISILCDPRLSLDQVQELKQGLQDGISIKEIRQIANPDLSIDVVREIRRFISVKEELPYTDCQIAERISDEAIHIEQNAPTDISEPECENRDAEDEIDFPNFE